MSLLESHIDAFPRQRVLVVGDVILDHYIRGSVGRTSPEAPVPIMEVEDEEYLPGGAANVAVNIAALGAKAELVGVVGPGEPGRQLELLLAEVPRLGAHLVVERERPTTVKTRCVAQGQQMLRLDREVKGAISAATREAVLKKVRRQLPRCSGVILSDYGKGLLQPDLIEGIVEEARAAGVRVLVDPKGRDYTRYRGATALTPNQKEASEASGVAIEDDDSLVRAARAIQKMVQGEAVVITRGAAGMSVFPRRGKPVHIPARAREVFDVTGAGDTVIAALGLSLFAGADWADAAALGNLAAGIVVGLAGVACVSADALRAAVQGEDPALRSKLVSDVELQQICRSLHQTGRRIVFTNGFFDLLHHGHVRLLTEARKMGDALIVAINSDASTRRLRGAPRPILKCEERIDLLSSLPAVDHLVVFDEDTPERLLRLVRPHVLVKGSATGSTKDAVVGADFVESYGGDVRLVVLENEPRISSILERAAAQSGKKPRGKSTRKKG